MKKLLVLPRAAALVPHFEHYLSALASGGLREHRYVGRTVKVLDGGHVAYEPVHEPVEVPSVPDTDPTYREAWNAYRHEIAGGALWAADEETAALCGVAFDPHFGGEF